MPDKLKDLQLLFYTEASRYNVLPLDNSRIARLDPAIRPSLTRGRKSFDYLEGMTRIPEGASPDIKNKSWSITAKVDVKTDATGMLITQGGLFGGWGLYLDKGKPVFHYNFVGVNHYEVAGKDAIAPGKHTIKMDFAYEGGQEIGKSGAATISVDVVQGLDAELPAAGESSQGQPECAAHPARRCRLRHVFDVWRTGADAAHGQAGEQRPEVQPVSHHRVVQPDAGRCSPVAITIACGTGVIIEMGTGYPGYTGIIPKSTALVSQTLRDNGYATGMFGKWHNTPEPDISPAGPFDRWPTGLGFDYFYGFNQGETHQYYPTMYRNTTWTPQPKSPEQGYHFTADMTDEAIAWTRNMRRLDRDKPWFNYFSTCGHAPHQAPRNGATSTTASLITAGINSAS